LVKVIILAKGLMILDI